MRYKIHQDVMDAIENDIKQFLVTQNRLDNSSPNEWFAIWPQCRTAIGTTVWWFIFILLYEILALTCQVFISKLNLFRLLQSKVCYREDVNFPFLYSTSDSVRVQ